MGSTGSFAFREVQWFEEGSPQYQTWDRFDKSRPIQCVLGAPVPVSMCEFRTNRIEIFPSCGL